MTIYLESRMFEPINCDKCAGAIGTGSKVYVEAKIVEPDGIMVADGIECGRCFAKRQSGEDIPINVTGRLIV